MVAGPLGPLGLGILVDGVLEFVLDALAHHALDLVHPVLDVLVVGVDLLHKVYLLLLGGEHGDDGLLVGELDGVDVFEDLLEVGLNGSGLLGLGEDLEQIVVGEEVEAGKFLPLLLEVLVEALLNLLELVVAFLELFKEALGAADLHDVDKLLG